jgi:Rod binding domain-containing protein
MAAAAKAPGDPRLRKAAQDFEQAFVRNILDAAHFGGKDGEKGYGAMAVEALASGIESGGGLGLARQIEHALSRQHEAERPGLPTGAGKQ